MTYVIGAAAGLVYGGLFGLLKHWVRVGGKTQDTTKRLYIYMSVAMLINIVALLSVYFLRNIWPWSFTAMLIATAVALSITGKLSALREQKLYQRDKQQQDQSLQ